MLKQLIPKTPKPFRKIVPKDDLTLFSRFHRWSGKSKRLKLDKKPEFDLSGNLFASILASPPRKDLATRARVPRDLLFSKVNSNTGRNEYTSKLKMLDKDWLVKTKTLVSALTFGPKESLDKWDIVVVNDNNSPNTQLQQNNEDLDIIVVNLKCVEKGIKQYLEAQSNHERGLVLGKGHIKLAKLLYKLQG